MRVLYTYRIGWSEHNKHYYGVRYANKYSPKLDLWKVYFTSSRHVKNFRKLYGEPDIIQVRKQFIVEDPDSWFKLKKAVKKARKWEGTVLRRLGVRKTEVWLNKADGGKKRSTAKKLRGIATYKAQQQNRIQKKRDKQEEQLEKKRQEKRKKRKELSQNAKIYSKNTRGERKKMLQDFLL